MSKILVLIHRNGQRSYYDNWDDFTRKIDKYWVKANLTDDFRKYDVLRNEPGYYHIWPYVGQQRHWILEDYQGKTISPEYVLSFYPERRRRYYGRPGRKYSLGGYYAPSNQTQELKANISVRELEKELDVRIKARFRQNIPNPWDDERGRSCYGDRSWKRYRKNRWKDSGRC